MNMDLIRFNILEFKNRVNEAAATVSKTLDDINIVVAIKTQPIEIVSSLKDMGITSVGENRVQEMLSRYSPDMGLDWQFIGQLQTNKVKYIIDKVSLIQSVDRESLASQINKEAQKRDIITNVLIEVNSAEEESKAGLRIKDVFDFAKSINRYENIRVKGIMSVMPYIDDQDKLEYYFRSIKEVYDSLDDIDGAEAKYLSLGMSNDFELAIKCGSNMIRPGRIIFGERSNL